MGYRDGILEVLGVTHEKVKTEYTASDVNDILIGIGGNCLVIENPMMVYLD